MRNEDREDDRRKAASASQSAVDGTAMSRLFARGCGTEADGGDFDEVSLALARAYCFSMDSGLGAARDAASREDPNKRRSGGD